MSNRDMFISREIDRTRINPASEELQMAILQAVRQSSGEGAGYNLLSGPDEVTVTTASHTLGELGISWNAGVKRVTLIPEAIGISWARGVAVSGINPFPWAAIEMDITYDRVKDLEFITASGIVAMTVVQEG